MANTLGFIGFWQSDSLMPSTTGLPGKLFGFMPSWIAGNLRPALLNG
jgi:hypothetical protein